MEFFWSLLINSRRVELADQQGTLEKEPFWSRPSSSSTPWLVTSSGVGDAGDVAVADRWFGGASLRWPGRGEGQRWSRTFLGGIRD
jgi:hypothetical protein